ncbi:allantoicase [Euzebya sp.]|uniref:allantoicase n=1 Tax=Euzebya sp. TaxID=1971409 RepID=UPI003516A63D
MTASPRAVDAADTPFTGLVDLAAKRLGGMVLAANDEFFGAKENLLDPLGPTFDPRAYTDRGKVMDGWETRRRRGPDPDGTSHDWCTVRLGMPGVVEAVVVDTTFFRGNFPEAFDLSGAICGDGGPDASTRWLPLIGRTPLRGDEVQRVVVEDARRVTHVRFAIHPDGGVARLRLLGRPVVDLHRVADPGGRMDLAALVNGGRVVACSDAFFGAPSNMIMVGDAIDMGDGWETRRRRGPGPDGLDHDWAVVELATTGEVERIEIDTTHFKGNYPDRCTVQAIDAPGAPAAELVASEGWVTLVDDHRMSPHARHVLDVASTRPASHLRLAVIPDGGVARFRVFGRVTAEGWRRAGTRLLDLAGSDEARTALLACCGSTAWADAMTARRPFGSPESLLAAADEVWEGLTADDHLEAFAAHPRIGERSASRWSTAEQSGTAGAPEAVLDRLAAGNAAYEQRFGHVFLIRAAGRSAEEVLEALTARLGNDPEAERRIAAEQQREITRLRLEALLAEGRPG